MDIGESAAGWALKYPVLGIPVSARGVGEVQELLQQKRAGNGLIVTFVNPWACALAQKHPDYVQLLEGFDVVACDGIGMVKAARASSLGGVERESFDFTSKADEVFRWALTNAVSIGLVGGKPGVASRAKRALQARYPGLAVGGCFSGYGPDVEDALAAFTAARTGLVICGMGAPLQERFLTRLVAGGWCGVGFTCGGFFDQLGRGESYYPAWADRLNLRFLYRLCKEPRRLWRRYLVDYRVFLWAYIRMRWGIVKSNLGLKA